MFSKAFSFFEENCPFSAKELKDANQDLTAGYRSKDKIKNGFYNDKERFSYLFSRFPSTYQACLKVLEHLPKTIEIETSLDIGSGPATASLALGSFYPDVAMTLCEQDKVMGTLGESMIKKVGLHFVTSYDKVSQIEGGQVHDLVMLSYVLGELNEAKQKKLLTQADALCGKAIVIIAPGTPRSYASFLQWRTLLIDKGYHIHAPCTHQQACPLPEGDWCHFKAHVERPKIQQYLKNATMGFEEEPYIYLIALKSFKDEGSTAIESRLLASPRKRKGHMHLKVCHQSGQLRHETITKESSLYTVMKKAEPGDGF